MSNSEFQGLDAWLRNIENISDNLVEEVKNLVGETAYKLEADAKLLCPVDTGRLRQSIHTQFESDNLKAEVGTNVDYSESVEFGTTRQIAQPYMTPAFAKWKPKFLDGMKDIVKRVGD